MDDFTKIKLINSLIDVVERFYREKSNLAQNAQNHLKGFCEGMAYALIEMEYIDKDEAATILKGLGKKCQEAPKIDTEVIFKPESHCDDLDIPTFLRNK